MIATRKDFQQLRNGLADDMQVASRVSTMGATLNAHLKSCDERGRRVEEALERIAFTGDKRHAQNQRVMWAIALLIVTGMCSMLGYLLIHGTPYHIITGN